MNDMNPDEIRQFLATLSSTELMEMFKEPVVKQLDVEIIHKYAFRLCRDNDTAWEAVSKAWLQLDQTRSVGEQVNFMRKRVWRELHDQWRRDKRYVCESKLVIGEEEEKYNSAMALMTAEYPSTDNTNVQLINMVLKESPEHLSNAIIYVMTHLFDGYFRTTIKPEDIRNLLKNAKQLGLKNVRQTAYDVYDRIMWTFG